MQWHIIYVFFNAEEVEERDLQGTVDLHNSRAGVKVDFSFLQIGIFKKLNVSN